MVTRFRASGNQSFDFETEHELARQETLAALLQTQNEIKARGVKSRRALLTGTQYGLTIGATVVTLTVPNEANCAEIYVRTASIVFTRSRTDPTATLGFQADPTDIILLNSRSELEQFEAIRQGGTSATVDVEYFSDTSS